MKSTDIPAGLWLQLWANQQQEERFVDGIKEFVRLYYKEFGDATQIEIGVQTALEVLFDALMLTPGIEAVVREVEAEINAEGGVYSEWDRKSHPVQTYLPEEEEDE